MIESNPPGAEAVVAFIGLGSNLDDPAMQVRRALEALDGVHDTRVAGVSRLYRSSPLGPPGQPDYVNAVAAVETLLPAHALLDALQGIETLQGRVRGERWGPRIIDLDILTYGERRIEDERLSIPHPGIAVRPFVLRPLADLLEGVAELPGLGRLDTLLTACPGGGVEPL